MIARRAKRKLKLTENVIGQDDADLEAHGPASATSTDLRSMITFGLHTLHTTGEESENKTLDSMVRAALTRRGSPNSEFPDENQFDNMGIVTMESQDENAENFYNYEGQDFSKVSD